MDGAVPDGGAARPAHIGVLLRIPCKKSAQCRKAAQKRELGEMPNAQRTQKTAAVRVLGQVLAVSGSIMAFHVGSGFASGQEILQFYTAFGPVGGLAVCALAFCLFSLFAFHLLEAGRRQKNQPVQLQYMQLGGTLVGRLFYWLTPFLMALVLCVTIAGGGAALQTLFGVGPLWGRLLIGLPVLLTVLLGLRWITALAGSLGPVIILCALCLGCFGILQGRDTQLWTLIPHSARNWAVSGVSYACFGTITQIPFLLTVGAGLGSRRQSAAIALLGNGGYMLTGAVLHLGLYRSLPQVLAQQLPALCLAGRLSSLAGWFYGIILLFSIYTTAVPLLWSVSRTFEADETGGVYRLAAVGMTAVACFGARLPFDRLLGTLYPCIGYVSTIFFAIMLLRPHSRTAASPRRSGHKDASAA